MSETERKEHRYLDGRVSGLMWEGYGLRFRVSARLMMNRDGDGSWLVYSELGDKTDETSEAITILDPAACAAMDAIFELIADPLEFKDRIIGERSVKDTEAA
jgi:hypothetical protein